MLLGMINDILDLAKIESGKMEVRTEDFSIRDVCEALATLARPIAERKKIDLDCRLDEAIPLLRQDPGKLRQILYNLLSNAIKFTPEGGKVTLDARAEGRNVVIAVADTGIGIAEEDRDKIFEKFRQAGQPGQAGDVLTREHQGTGLGLSIVRELTKLLGGDVTPARAGSGQGSTFTVRLPMQLPGNRKFEVNLSDERIDLTKARRVEARAAMAHLGLAGPERRPTPAGRCPPPIGLKPARSDRRTRLRPMVEPVRDGVGQVALTPRRYHRYTRIVRLMPTPRASQRGTRDADVPRTPLSRDAGASTPGSSTNGHLDPAPIGPPVSSFLVQARLEAHAGVRPRDRGAPGLPLPREAGPSPRPRLRGVQEGPRPR